jgi:hypothetical protein
MDKKWYSVEKHQGYHIWRGKIVVGLMRLAIINAWVWPIRTNYMDWPLWHETVCIELMQHSIPQSDKKTTEMKS